MGSFYPRPDSWWKLGPINYQGRTLAQWVQSLFGGGVPGVLYTPSPATCFQDVDGEEPAGVGDPVALMLDLSGNANNAMQADSDDSRPTLEQDSNGFFYLAFDGIDDYLQAAFTVSQPMERISGLRFAGWNQFRVAYDGIVNIVGRLQQGITAPDLRIASGQAGSPIAVPAGEITVVTERHWGANSRIAKNNEAYVTSNVGSVLPGGITIGATQTLSAFMNFRCYGIFMRGGPTALTDAEIALVRRYIGSLCGIAL